MSIPSWAFAMPWARIPTWPSGWRAAVLRTVTRKSGSENFCATRVLPAMAAMPASAFIIGSIPIIRSRSPRVEGPFAPVLGTRAAHLYAAGVEAQFLSEPDRGNEPQRRPVQRLPAGRRAAAGVGVPAHTARLLFSGTERRPFRAGERPI